ncbi:DEAD/DEAH box helicase [Chryseobacterium indoltheticum]|uniref:DEAD/DEAH box helicase n=1 Tax=Chryseobacterium indoltheticum TaxID=254 RepID=UPI003F49334F
METLKDFDAAETQLLEFVNGVPNDADLQTVVQNIHQLEDWINFNVLKEKAQDLNLNWFINFLEKGWLDTESIELEFEKIIHLNLFIKTIYSSGTLNGFDANIYESQIQQYKNLHKEFTELTKNQLTMKLSDRIPNFSQEAVQSSEIGILQKAIRNKGRGLSIRKLFDQIPTLIPRLKPCMLMSPISVAQYFDVNEEHFDIVIFDEASQLPTSEAVSALARAKQAIIVGDPKQMPPTSFFASQKVDEENFELEDLESILDDCLALSIPSNYLLRHYRSKHESLISFSNAHFYDNKLLTFPSPDDLNRKVTFEFIDGFYDKGKTRTNKNEAEAIIEYIRIHLENKNKKSIGVVTFSQTQQSLIEDLLQKLFLENPHLEEFAINSEEPIFIKNLENVQGDERDIILFSIGYGPDEEGKVSMNFGPLNRDGGWRRLNVAVTRARYEMKVFLL